VPKRVDHVLRRQTIAEAVLRITAGLGLEAVSVRDVAAEAGVSGGLVQHYFRSKDEMLIFACEYLIERTRLRVQQRLSASTGPSSTRSILRNLFLEQLPLDAERRAAVCVWIAFLTRGFVEPRLAVFLRDTYAETLAFVATQIGIAQASGEIAADLDRELEASRLVCLVDGLVPRLLVGHYAADLALAEVDAQMDRLWGTTPERP
jgi:TetR/AcrR family transcriptional regulator, transcriptional repressor of bet genes